MKNKNKNKRTLIMPEQENLRVVRTTKMTKQPPILG